MDRNAARHLVHNYGDRAHLVAAIADSGFNKPLHPKYQFTEAEVIYAIDFECAATAVDALARRTRLAFLDRDAAFEALPKVITLMANKLGWDAVRQEKEYDSAVSFLDTMHAWAYYKVSFLFYNRKPVQAFCVAHLNRCTCACCLTLRGSSKTRVKCRADRCQRTSKAFFVCVCVNVMAHVYIVNAGRM